MICLFQSHIFWYLNFSTCIKLCSTLLSPKVPDICITFLKPAFELKKILKNKLVQDVCRKIHPAKMQLCLFLFKHEQHNIQHYKIICLTGVSNFFCGARKCFCYQNFLAIYYIEVSTSKIASILFKVFDVSTFVAINEIF